MSAASLSGRPHHPFPPRAVDRRSHVIFAALLLGLAAGAPADETATEPALYGQTRYLEICARCHQPDGAGLPGLYPSLKDAPHLWADRSRAMQAVLGGEPTPPDSDADERNRSMPNHGYLANEDIAETLSYVQAAWGPEGPAFSAEEVSAERRKVLEAADRRHGVPEDLDALTAPLASMPSTRQITSNGPALTTEEFAAAQALYYGHCTGCHGVMREGTAGNPLTPEVMQSRGTEYLRERISYGMSSGMPGWGTDAVLTGEDIDLLARFLQHPVPEPPDMQLEQIRDTWHVYTSRAERTQTPPLEHSLRDLFVVALHDIGQLAFIDGSSRSLIGTVDVGQSPHEVVASASGRYLYVICRDGTLSQIDLWSSPPERVASVRVGYEARAVAASAFPAQTDAAVLAGAYWPPQLVMVDGTTLEPLSRVSTRNRPRPGHPYHPEPRVSDIVASRSAPVFIASIRETGEFGLLDHSRRAQTALRRIDAVRDLRGGLWALDQRHLLVPADSQAIAVLDSVTGNLVAEIPAPVTGASPGTSYLHRTLGPVWVTAGVRGKELLAIGTDPEQHADLAWQIAARAPTPAPGTLFLATHPAQPDLWLDTPLARDPAAAGSLTVFAKDALDAGFTSLPVAQWSGLATGPRRALQPTFNANGTEVWALVWNTQDEPSALVVIDAATRAPRAVIKDPRLITPTRLYRVGALIDAARGEGTRTLGEQLFTELCANCHGPYGAGDGPLAASQSVMLKDLRDLAQRSGGVFPRDFVTDIIDGRAFRSAHGPEGMPVWGAELLRDAPLDSGAEDRVNAWIDALTNHLETMQR